MVLLKGGRDGNDVGEERGQQERAKREKREKRKRHPLVCFGLSPRWAMVYLLVPSPSHPVTLSSLSSSPWPCSAMQWREEITPCTIKERRRFGGELPLLPDAQISSWHNHISGRITVSFNPFVDCEHTFQSFLLVIV